MGSYRDYVEPPRLERLRRLRTAAGRIATATPQELAKIEPDLIADVEDTVFVAVDRLDEITKEQRRKHGRVAPNGVPPTDDPHGRNPR